MHQLDLLIGFAARAGLGLGLALIFSTVAIVVAWLTYLFFGLTSWGAWFAMFVLSGGIGAAAGSAVIVGGTGPSGRILGFAVLLLLMVAAGVAGALGGFSFGDGREVACCARPDMGPLAYSVIGATLAAGGAGVLVRALRLGGGLLKPLGRASEYREVGTRLRPGLERDYSPDLND